jgi:F-type H+-transporting ATPase subunit alpha
LRPPLFKIKVQEKGTIRDIKEMIVRIEGLPSCLNGQIVNMGEGVKGIIMGFDEHSVLALALGEHGRLRMGQTVTGISEPFKIPVGECLLGRMVSAMGDPCDHAGPIEAEYFSPVLRDSVPLTGRVPITGFFPTGTKIIDMLLPLSKGQRELVLGDRMTGKTVLAVDAILNQKGRNVVCLYCCIGKSVSGLQKVLTVLHEAGALAYTTVVAATDNAPVGEQYLVPFSAASMGEYFVGRGEDVLVVFDDLTKHAWAYRQLSLLMDRPPGREAYPGDIFYVQTQLMERAGCFDKAHGGGTMTFLGLAETLQGDLTGYIPSNLVSMCDGQVCLSSSIFAEGFRPAVDLGLSISIVGGRVQPPVLKALAQDMGAAYARYSELVKLSRVSTGLSGPSERLMKRGEVFRVMLTQEQNRPVSVAECALLLCAIRMGVLEPLGDVKRMQFRDGIHAFASRRDEALIAGIETARSLTPEIEQGLQRLVAAFLRDLDSTGGGQP